MEPKPKGWGPDYAAVFGDESVVERYHLRPPYPAGTFLVLASLARGGAVVDIGCGPGDLARPLAARVARVDAVDVSAPMIERGRRLAGGDAPNLRWIVGRFETAALDPPYALAVAGDSIHWLDWEAAFPRLVSLLARDGFLAVVHRDWLRDERARERLRSTYTRHSWNVDYEPLDPVEELERRGLFERTGEHTTEPAAWRPTLDEIVEGHFSMSGFAPDRLDDPEAFARELRETLRATLEPREGRYDLDVTATITWGRVLDGTSSATTVR
jgi:SAM-dependent methyltransferase